MSALHFHSPLSAPSYYRILFKLKKCKFDLEQKHFLIFIFSFVKESDKEFLCIRNSEEEFFMHGIQLIMFTDQA